uniref:Uncharacterized protein n=1 Tax=Arundo donax TaxID=35708 RepID=A0A0A9HTR4_ARUDO
MRRALEGKLHDPYMHTHFFAIRFFIWEHTSIGLYCKFVFLFLCQVVQNVLLVVCLPCVAMPFQFSPNSSALCYRFGSTISLFYS